MTTIVYRYGLLPPTENAATVREQMRLAHKYQNDLVAIERHRRESWSRMRERYVPGLAEAEEALAKWDAELKRIRDLTPKKRKDTYSKTRQKTREMPSPENKAAERAAAAQRKAARETLKPLKAAFAEMIGPASREYERRRIERCSDPDPTKDNPDRRKAKPAVIVGQQIPRLRAEMLAEAEWHSAWKESVALDVEADAKWDAVKASCGVYSGTQALVVDAVVQAIGDAMPGLPNFQRWCGEGSVGVQVHQKGQKPKGSKDVPMTVPEFLNGTGNAKNWLHSTARGVETRPPHSNPSVEAARRRNAERRANSKRGNTRELRDLHVRVDSTDSGEPVMATFPMVMHRPLPPNAIIKRVVVQCRKIGPREEWYCCLTVATEGLLRDPAPTCGGAVAVEIGWRTVPLDPHPKRPGVPRVGVQVARYLTTGGRAEPLVIDLTGLRKADELRSIREKNFNEARAALVDWLRENTVPEWMRALTVKRGSDLPSEAQAIAYLEQWKSQGRLAGLCLRMAAEGFGGDAAAYAKLREHLRSTRHRGDTAAVEAVNVWRAETGLFDGEAGAMAARMETWRYHDNHLWRWESDQRKKTERMRQDTYRVFAAKLASEHPRLLVSDAVYSEMARRPDVDGERTNETAERNRQGSAPGALREALVAAFKARGGEVMKVSAAGLSTTCPDCGSCDPGQRDNVGRMCRCVACQAEHDIDDTALLNMLRLGGETAAVVDIKTARKTIKDAIEGDSHAAE